MGYEKTKTMTGTIVAEDGTELTLVVPAELPTDERADYLRNLWTLYVREQNATRWDQSHRASLGWKGPVLAFVGPEWADDVAEAMEFMGAIVDERKNLGGGTVRLFSRGYYAHGF